jgi:putative ABC transport system ATP-binding protein
MSILRAEEATYVYRNKYQTVRAVNGVSYSFELGKFYAILGKSGSGKTTLLSLLAGLDLPTSGRIVYEETPTDQLDRNAYRRDHATVIYQNFNLFPLLTALENVEYPLWLKGVSDREAEKRATEMLRSMDISEDMFKRYPAMLSGGEQQRIAIARALCTDAQVILADETTGNLDSENGANVLSILKSLAHNKNRCVIVVTHDISIAGEADEVLRMRDGEINQEEPAS